VRWQHVIGAIERWQLQTRDQQSGPGADDRFR